MRSDSQRRWLRIWFGTIAATTLLVLVVGGITRLTHSGLSIVEWRPLVGILPPLSQSEWAASFERYQQFPEFQKLRPYMTLAEYQRIFYWEYFHRLIARGIGLVFVIPFAYFYFSGTLTRPLVRRALVLFGLGVLQGIAGWLMVRSGLIDRPSVSHYRLAIHLMLAVAIFGLCIWLIRDLSLGSIRTTATALARRRASQALILVGGLLGLQIVWGAFVAGLKAGFLFNNFPLMGDALVPNEYWAPSPTALALVQHQVGVQWMHRLLGTLLLSAAFVPFLVARRMRMDRTSARLSVALLWAIGAQYALGVFTLWHVVPIGLAVAHQAMAMAVVGVWVCAIHHVRHLHISNDHSGRERARPVGRLAGK